MTKTDTVTTNDRLTVVKMLAKGHPVSYVRATNGHLTDARIEAIAEDAGYPDRDKLRHAADQLQLQLDDERAGVIRTVPTPKPGNNVPRNQEPETGTRSMDHAPTVTARTPSAPPPSKQTPATVASRVQQVAPGPRPYDATIALLLEAHDSPSKRTVALVDRIEQLLTELRTRMVAEATARREAEAREHEREVALAEVARAEEALRVAREKARKFKNHPGGNGRAEVLQSQSSESRQPGGRASIDANRAASIQDAAAIYARHAVTAADVRDWAHQTGQACPDKGRIPGKVLTAYDAAHPLKGVDQPA